jgi:hypothetical protein
LELWEGAILVVGGIALVGYMSKKNLAMRQTGVAAINAATTVTPAGTSNESNLTTITNQAGGYPAILGESLTPPTPPLLGNSSPGFVSAPARGTIARPASSPVAPTTVRTVPIAPVRVLGGKPILGRPMDLHL